MTQGNFGTMARRTAQKSALPSCTTSNICSGDACARVRAGARSVPRGAVVAASSFVVGPELFARQELDLAALDLAHTARELVIPGGRPFLLVEDLAAKRLEQLGALVLRHLGGKL